MAPETPVRLDVTVTVLATGATTAVVSQTMFLGYIEKIVIPALDAAYTSVATTYRTAQEQMPEWAAGFEAAVAPIAAAQAQALAALAELNAA